MSAHFPRSAETAHRHQSSAHRWNARTQLEPFQAASRSSKAVGKTRIHSNLRHKQICKFPAPQPTTSTLRLGLNLTVERDPRLPWLASAWARPTTWVRGVPLRLDAGHAAILHDEPQGSGDRAETP